MQSNHVRVTVTLGKTVSHHWSATAFVLSKSLLFDFVAKVVCRMTNSGLPGRILRYDRSSAPARRESSGDAPRSPAIRPPASAARHRHRASRPC